MLSMLNRHIKLPYLIGRLQCLVAATCMLAWLSGVSVSHNKLASVDPSVSEQSYCYTNEVRAVFANKHYPKPVVN